MLFVFVAKRRRPTKQARFGFAVHELETAAVADNPGFEKEPPI